MASDKTTIRAADYYESDEFMNRALPPGYSWARSPASVETVAQLLTKFAEEHPGAQVLIPIAEDDYRDTFLIRYDEDTNTVQISPGKLCKR